MEYDKEYNRLVDIEGGWGNDPDDPGGETYKGIARAFHPTWEGWEIIDRAKTLPDFPKCLASHVSLDAACRAFYRREFWDRFTCDAMPPDLAGEIFEQAVNLGLAAPAKHLQMVLNAVNFQQALGADLIVDGGYGPKTLTRLKVALAAGKGKAILAGVNALQGAAYIEKGLTNPTKRKYVNGWLAQRVA